jgi:hypothetical protein
MPRIWRVRCALIVVALFLGMELYSYAVPTEGFYLTGTLTESAPGQFALGDVFSFTLRPGTASYAHTKALVDKTVILRLSRKPVDKAQP